MLPYATFSYFIIIIQLINDLRKYGGVFLKKEKWRIFFSAKLPLYIKEGGDIDLIIITIVDNFGDFY